MITKPMMRKRTLILIIPLVLTLVPAAMGVCTVTLDKASYSPGETVTASMQCDAANERNRAYTLIWTNSTDQPENDTGTVPNTINEVFLETYVLASAEGVGGIINANLTGTNLEGFDESNITAAGASDLVITATTHQGTFLGLSSSIHAEVTDENSKGMTGGRCVIRVKDPTTNEVFVVEETEMISGEISARWIMDYTSFSEGKDFLVNIACFCGSDASDSECLDEDGVSVVDSVGTAAQPFTTDTWITFNEDPFPITDANGTKVGRQNLSAGFSIVNALRNVSNSNPLDEPVIADITLFLVENATQKSFGAAENFQVVIGSGNSTAVFSRIIEQTADTGQYVLRAIIDVIYKGQFQVAQYIKDTEIFNVTSIQDSFAVNEISQKEFFGNKVNTSATLTSSSSITVSNSTNPFFILTEGFNFDVCFDVTNNNNQDVTLYIDELLLENPTLNSSFAILNGGKERKLIVENNTDSVEVCSSEILPQDLETHSDYRISFLAHVGTVEDKFECGIKCQFEGHGDFFFIGAIEDTIVFEKFHTKPTASALGNPGVFIVTERNEYITMFDDYNYTSQAETEWNNATAICNSKGSNDTFLCDLAAYPKAGEDIKVCFESRNFFADEVFVDFFNIYLDNDLGDSIQILKGIDDEIENGLKSITDADLYLGTATNRQYEGDGNLMDGFATLCTDWLTLPDDINGGNGWDVQGRARLSETVYNLDDDLTWTWESDEFPIFGKFDSNPDILFSSEGNIPHYRIIEQWQRQTPTSFRTNMSIPVIDNSTVPFIFSAHVTRNLLDELSPLERIENYTVTYQNGSEISFDTEMFSFNEETVILIHGINVSEQGNNFTVTLRTFDYANREVLALEGIENKTGTFQFSIDCESQGQISKPIDCTITAQVEESQVVEKEVDFTCYLLDENNDRFGTQNFNRMVTRSEIKILRSLDVPNDFVTNQEYTAFCEAGYYNLGSRTDTFSDTFIAIHALSGFQEIEEEKTVFTPENAIMFGVPALLIGGGGTLLAKRRKKDKREKDEQ